MVRTETGVGTPAKDAEAWTRLGMELADRGRSAESLRAFHEAASLRPDLGETWSNLGEALRRIGRLDEALACAVEALRREPGSAPFLYNQGRALHDLDRLAEAAGAFEAALRIDPGLASASLGLASSLEAQGDLERALAVLGDGLARRPGHAGLLAELATRSRGRLDVESRRRAEECLARPDLAARDRWSLLFGMAHVHDGTGEWELAAARSAEANALRREDLRALGRLASPEEHRAAVGRMIEAFDPAHFDRMRAIGAGLESETPAFIVGVPRSGTTLLEQILASHPQVVGAGELRLAQQGFTRMAALVGEATTLPEALTHLDAGRINNLAADHLNRLAVHAAGRTGITRIVDKMPGNMLFVGWLATLFPRARFLACDRDPRDTALSCWFTNFTELNWAFDPGNIATRIDMNARLSQHWRRVLPDSIRIVAYEQLVSDPEPVIRSMLEFLGLDWDDRCLAFHQTRRVVKTASLAQVRSPVHQRSVGRWRRYEPYLGELFRMGDG